MDPDMMDPGERMAVDERPDAEDRERWESCRTSSATVYMKFVVRKYVLLISSIPYYYLSYFASFQFHAVETNSIRRVAARRHSS